MFMSKFVCCSYIYMSSYLFVWCLGLPRGWATMSWSTNTSLYSEYFDSGSTINLYGKAPQSYSSQHEVWSDAYII